MINSFDIKSVCESLGIADQSLAQERLKICSKCPHYNGNQCQKCGCFMFIKARMKGMECPIGLWGKL